ncbi:membrane protein required for colicin V production [Kaistia soli DSM 19436]|uniref:Membrane protein required for colicin V production n=1 Tax=Kaistia soli DSM 19436 TaxID=1122133 RepID=A0A1M4UHP2_9HYPH|nr:CvpA family protein [Kaistia soli]SHE56168.1 membrane protein required for colicin V production [Kaistia soli DSM 19436]
MSVTILDGVVVVVVLISALLAMVRGFVREVLSVASWVLAAVAAFYFYKPLLPYVEPYIANKNIAIIATAAAIFFIALIIVSYLAMRISDFVVDSRVGLLDRTLGFVFGAARGVLLVVIAFAFLNWILSDRQPDWVANAQTAPILKRLGDRLVAALPEDIEKTIQERLHGTTPEEATPPVDAPADSPDAATTPPAAIPQGTTDQQAPAYGGKERQGLDSLIDNGDAPAEEPAAPNGTTGGQAKP